MDYGTLPYYKIKCIVLRNQYAPQQPTVGIELISYGYKEAVSASRSENMFALAEKEVIRKRASGYWDYTKGLGRFIPVSDFKYHKPSEQK